MCVCVCVCVCHVRACVRVCDGVLLFCSLFFNAANMRILAWRIFNARHKFHSFIHSFIHSSLYHRHLTSVGTFVAEMITAVLLISAQQQQKFSQSMSGVCGLCDWKEGQPEGDVH